MTLPVTKPPRRLRWWHLGLAAALVAGAVLRLAWVRDMEYKWDEVYMFERTRDVGVAEPWPWLGMPSGVNLRNPGLSVWVFLVPGKLLGGAEDPTVLARIPQLTSIAALLFLVHFALRRVEEGEREAWLWGVALAAVNPTCLVLHRKIWAQSALAPFSVLMLAGWWARRARWGAFLWGLVGVLSGQVHLSGFFFAAAFALWTALFDRKGVRWGCWLAGSLLGALPMVPWLAYLAAAPSSDWPDSNRWANWVGQRFWFFWLIEPLGLGIYDPLLRHFWEYLTYPVIGGRPTYLAGAAYATAALVGVAAYSRGALRLWRQRPFFRELGAGERSSTRLALGAALWGFGLLLTASGAIVHRHYWLVLFPLGFVWLARLALAGAGGPAAPARGRALLLTLFVAQLVLSATFLVYIHANQGAPRGWYGTAYGAQRLD